MAPLIAASPMADDNRSSLRSKWDGASDSELDDDEDSSSVGRISFPRGGITALGRLLIESVFDGMVTVENLLVRVFSFVVIVMCRTVL